MKDIKCIAYHGEHKLLHKLGDAIIPMGFNDETPYPDDEHIGLVIYANKSFGYYISEPIADKHIDVTKRNIKELISNPQHLIQ